MFISAEEVVKLLQEEEILSYIQDDWSEIIKFFPADAPLFLRDGEIIANAEYCGLSHEEIAFLRDTAAKIRENHALCLLAWYAYWKMYLGAKRLENTGKLPKLTKVLGEHAGAFYLLILLGIVPYLKNYHASLGVPVSASAETLLEVKSLMDNYKRAEGGIGICHRQLYWPQLYLHGNIFFRLGRFEYWVRPGSYRDAVNVYRSRKTGQTAVLLKQKNFYREDGLCDVEAERTPDTSYWQSEFKEEPGFVIGTPVSPDGHALRKSVKLSLDEWECVLNEKSMTLDMHIPAGGGMTPEACLESVTKARDFYRQYFPQLHPAAIVCCSWIFSPNLTNFLPADSNLVNFTKEVYLYPAASPKQAGIWFFFYQDKFDPKTAPRKTSLQKTLADYLEKGGDLRVGGMFLLLDDIDKFGTQYYLNNAYTG